MRYVISIGLTLILFGCTADQITQMQDAAKAAGQPSPTPSATPNPTPTPSVTPSPTPSPTAPPSAAALSTADLRTKFVQGCSNNSTDQMQLNACGCAFDVLIGRLGRDGFDRLVVAMANKTPLDATQQAAYDAAGSGCFVPMPTATATPAVAVPQAPVVATRPISLGTSAFGNLEGAAIVAQDGTFLGYMRSNRYDQQSIVNEFGPYGSEFQSKSIFNQFGSYGSEFATYSPFNRFASKPPLIVLGGEAVGYLTTNEMKTPRLDPYVLIGIVKSLR